MYKLEYYTNPLAKRSNTAGILDDWSVSSHLITIVSYQNANQALRLGRDYSYTLAATSLLADLLARVLL